MNTKIYGTSAIFKWNKEYLIKVLTSGNSPIVTDPIIINAFNKINREDFVADKFKPQAYSDIEIDIGYSEKLNRPTVIAQMISLLKPHYGGKYLDIGTGTGYSAAILGFIAGDEGHVYSIERVQWLWEEARQNLNKYKAEIPQIDLLFRDGIAGLPNQAPFDGIHIAFALKEIPNELKLQLKVGSGKLVCPTLDKNLKVLERNSIDQWTEEIIQGIIFDPGKIGIA